MEEGGALLRIQPKISRIFHCDLVQGHIPEAVL